MATQSGGRLSPLARLAAPALVALALLLGAAAAESGIAGGAAKVRAEPTSLAFTVATTLFGLAALAALANAVLALVRAFRLRGGGFEKERRPFARTVVSALATAFFVALLVYVVIHYRHPHLAAQHPRQPGAISAPYGHPKTEVHFVAPAAFGTIAAIAAVVVVMVAIAFWRRRRRSGWQREFGLADRSDREDLLHEEDARAGAIAEAISQVDVADPRAEPDPRRAVVLAYLQMSAAAEAAGAKRRHHETAREFLERLLDCAGCPPLPTRALTSCFELARYSRDPVTEADRTFAIRALEEIRRSLGATSEC